MKLFNLVFVAFVTLFSFGVAYAVIPPTPEPPSWDKSSVSVEGECKEGLAVFEIKNGGSGNMTGPSNWYFVQEDGGASSCAESVAAGYVLSGSFMLDSGSSVSITIGTQEYDPQYRLCVAQRTGHPGVGWASATVDKTCRFPTGLGELGEPVNTVRLFLPQIKGE